MENNNFEKQVQEKLADLNIQPSEKAWKEIEGRIGKKDRSKRVLWFILLGLFLLAGGGYLYMKDGKGTDKEIAQMPKQNTERIIQKNEIDQKVSPDAISKSDPIILNEENQVAKLSIDKSNDVQPSSLKSISRSQGITGKKKTNEIDLIGNEKVNVSIKNQDDQKPNELKIETGLLANSNEASKIKTDLNTDTKAENTEVLVQNEIDTSAGNKVLTIDSLTHKQEIITEIKQELPLKENNDLNRTIITGENKKTSYPSSSKSWEIGVTFSAAKVFIGEGIHLGSRLDKSNVANDPVNADNNYFSRPGNSVAQTPIGPASSPENSYGFNAGIVLKKGISSKISFVTGLGYTYYTNSLLIGNQLPGDKYSSAGMLSSYRNNFHFVDLPLSAQFHLNTKHKIPLDLSLGLNVSQLLTSNAVQYKSGFYEVDNSLFSKTQFGFQAGFSATFFRNLSVGPFYRYGMNSLAQDGLYGKKHLNFLGLKADFIFRKNK